MDPGSGGRLTRIAVRADRAGIAVRRVRDAGVHKRQMLPGATAVDSASVPWPDDPAVVFLRQRLGLGEDDRWRPVTTDELL